MQSDVWLRATVNVESGHLLKFGRRHIVLPAFCGRGLHQQRLLGRDRSGRQVWGSDFLRHKLFLDLVDQDEVIQLKRV